MSKVTVSGKALKKFHKKYTTRCAICNKPFKTIEEITKVYILAGEIILIHKDTCKGK